MKTILMLAASLLAWPLLSSCTEYGAYGQTGGYTTSSYGYSQSYAPLRVGFISTSYDRWSYDPYRRCYYDRSIGSYYNYNSRSYYTTAPRRYSSPRYPSGYRKGSKISCPSYLPRNSSRGNYGQRHVSPSSRYAPVLHGSSNRSSSRSQSIEKAARYNMKSRTSSSSSRQSSTYKSAPTVQRESSTQPSRRIETPRQVTRTSQPQTIRTSPSRTNTVRTSAPSTIRQTSEPRRSEPAPTIRQSSSSRATVPVRSSRIKVPVRSSREARSRIR